MDSNLQPMALRRIGQGFCGSVWATDSEATSEVERAHAIKREDGGPGRSLHNDYIMHLQVLSAFCSPNTPARVNVPACHQYIENNNSTWWGGQAQLFPPKFQVSCNALITDRIRPFPEKVRYKIIDAYCPESLRHSIKSSEPDQDCLVRPYLGRRRRLDRQSQFKAFSLRNYPLHVDQMEEMGLDVDLYARTMAEALAYLYWEAHVDVNDVEFVLAPAPSTTDDTHAKPPRQPQIFNSQLLGSHAMWILDFDCCRPMAMDEEGVEQAVTAFYRNDPFYPRPGKEDPRDQAIWQVFKDSFLEASLDILGRESVEASLVVKWIEQVEDCLSRQKPSG